MKSYFLPETFVEKRMRVRVASGKIHYAEGYGRMGHPMLQKVWYVPGFTCNLFSDAIAMNDGYSCRRIGRTLEYISNDEVVLEGTFDKSKWILQFHLSNTHQASPLGSSFTSGEGHDLSAGSIPHEGITEGQAMGTGMGLLPIPTQTVLMHRRSNHVSAEILYLALHKELTSGLCASPSSATLTQLSAIDCIACTMAKSRYANHLSRNAELRKRGVERQRVPGHINPRGVHSGLAPYEVLAIDLKTHLPPTRFGHTICMMIVCLYSMKRHCVSLGAKSQEFEAFKQFQSTIVEAQGFKTRRLQRWCRNPGSLPPIARTSEPCPPSF
jgi:hypothetical protein